MADNYPTTLAEIRKLSVARGHHWFGKDEMAFFGSIVYERVYPAESTRQTYFVSSEQYSEDTERRFSVRSISWDSGQVRTCGTFMAYSTEKAARRMAAAMAGCEVPNA